MPHAEEIRRLLSGIPEPNENGTYADWDERKAAAIDAVVAELCRRGADAIRALVGMLVEPGKGDDVKPRFALHLLAVYVTQPGAEQLRQQYVEVLAAELAADHPRSIKEFLIERLQLAGTRAVVPALGKLLTDPQLCDAAARALMAIGDGAAEQFLAALPRLRGASRRCVIARLAMMGAEGAAPAFQQALDDPDPETRIAAGWGIARLAVADAAEKLLQAADTAEGWERIAHTDACMCLADTLAAAGRTQPAAGILQHLAQTRKQPAEAHVRTAAQRALERLKQRK